MKNLLILKCLTPIKKPDKSIYAPPGFYG